MRIFVAGATGVLGRRVVPALVDHGHEVVAVARGADKAAGLRAHGADAVPVDLFDAGAVATAVAGSDAVVNLATAIPSTGRMLRRSAWRTNDRLRTEASRNLVDAALATGAGRYVQEALGFMYGDHGATWIDEDAPLQVPSFAEAVLEAEAQARRFGEQGRGAVVLRFAMFYAADSPQTAQMVQTARRGLYGLPGPADAYQSWVHIDDAAAAVVAAVTGPPGTYNVVEDHPLTNREHLDVLTTLLGRRLRTPPSWMAVGEQLRLSLRSQRVSNRRLRERTGWRPTFGSRRDGWADVLAHLDAPPAHV